MKFDCIIMNPPYERNLHLKILAEAIKHLKDDESKCVCLHPPQEYKKFKLSTEATNCLSYIESYDEYSSSIILKLFGVGTNNGLISAIYSNNSNKEIQDKLRYSRNNVFYKSIFNKIVQSKLPSVKTMFEHIYDCNKPIFFNFPEYCGGGGYDGLPIVFNKSYCINGNWKNKPSKKIGFQIVFENETELINFVTSYDTNFYKFLAGMFNWSLRIYYNGFPWMGDAINPRTGKKGYEGEWTDSDFYTFFGITPEEQKVIEETMEKYR